MSLSTKEAASGSGLGGIKITDGVFANKQVITKVRDLSGKKIEHIDKAFDLAIELEYEGEMFPQTFFGNLKTDAAGAAIGWGGAFIVALLFENTNSTAQLNSKNRFDTASLKELIGKEIVTISYCNGTYNKDGKTGNSYTKWNQTFSVYEEDEDLIDAVLKAWENSRKNGYPKNFEYPKNFSGSPSEGLSTGAKSKSTAGKSDLTASIDGFEDMDDDLPF